jgi:hypothetical protein
VDRVMVVQAVDKVLVGRVVGPERGDPGLIYVPNGGEGNVTVVHQDSADAYSVVATVQTFQGAKTIALDPVTHNAYQFQPERGPAAASTANTATPVAGPGGYGRGPQGPIIAAWFIVIRGQYFARLSRSQKPAALPLDPIWDQQIAGNRQVNHLFVGGWALVDGELSVLASADEP